MEEKHNVLSVFSDVVSTISAIIFGVFTIIIGFKANQIIETEMQPIINVYLKEDESFVDETIDLCVENVGFAAKDISISTINFYEILCSENNFGEKFSLIEHVDENRKISLNVYSGDLWSGHAVKRTNNLKGELATIECYSGQKEEIKKITDEISDIASSSSYNAGTAWYCTYNTLICVKYEDLLGKVNNCYYLLRCCSLFDVPAFTEAFYNLNELIVVDPQIGDDLFTQNESLRKTDYSHVSGEDLFKDALKIVRDNGAYEKGFNNSIVCYGEYEPYSCNFAN